MLRSIYYFLPPKWRYVVRWLVYWPVDFLSPRSMAPPRRLIYTGRGDFLQQGLEWKYFFINNAGLTPNSHFLDVGSGIGRIALPLMDYLTDRYEGFDAVSSGVEWCQRHISNKAPNFTFRFIPLHNDLYNAKGMQAAHFVFPYEDNSFDFACVISVFTHMLPPEVNNYLAQLKRVMKPGAKVVVTLFLLSDESKQFMSIKDEVSFVHMESIDGTYRLMNTKVKAANVAYEKTYIWELCTLHGWEVLNFIGGYWCGRPKSLDIAYQDILILQKIA